MTKVEKAILQTFAFFDIFKRPLTLDEVWRFLYKIRASKLQVLFGLKNLQKKKIILEKNNYYFLADSKNSFKVFMNNQPIQKKNWRKVNWVIKILQYAPFVKNISIINSLAFGASNKDSDIDIMLIAKKNRLWTTRAFVIFLLEVIGQNKNRWYQAGKFCLGFAFDEEKLDLTGLLFKEDIYFPFWLATLQPVFDRSVYQDFIGQNQWLCHNLPNWSPDKIKSAQTKLSAIERFLSGRLGDKLERWLKKIQIKRVWSDPKNIRTTQGAVIADTHMLKMHPYDKRLKYQNQWLTNCQKLLK